MIVTSLTVVHSRDRSVKRAVNLGPTVADLLSIDDSEALGLFDVFESFANIKWGKRGVIHERFSD